MMPPWDVDLLAVAFDDELARSHHRIGQGSDKHPKTDGAREDAKKNRPLSQSCRSPAS